MQSNGETNVSASNISDQGAAKVAAAPETKAEEIKGSGDDASENQSEPGTNKELSIE